MFLQQNTPLRSRILVTACVFCLLYILIAALPATVFELLFCRIPAWLASLYLGAPCDGTAMALRSGHILAVTHACGGSDFFILICSMIAWYATAPGGLQLNGGATSLSSALEGTVTPVPRSGCNPTLQKVSSFKFQLGRAFILLFMAWAFVNAVNSLRVVLSAWTRLASEALLPERFDAAVHMVSGVMIFFPALLVVWWICKTRTNEVLNERKN